MVQPIRNALMQGRDSLSVFRRKVDLVVEGNENTLFGIPSIRTRIDRLSSQKEEKTYSPQCPDIPRERGSNKLSIYFPYRSNSKGGV